MGCRRGRSCHSHRGSGGPPARVAGRRAGGYVPGMSARVDLVALHAEEYAAVRAPRVVPTTPARYLSLDGVGEFQGEGFG